MNPILTSIADAGQMLSIGRCTIYRLISEGKLETVKIGRRNLITLASIRRLAGESEGRA